MASGCSVFSRVNSNSLLKTPATPLADCSSRNRLTIFIIVSLLVQTQYIFSIRQSIHKFDHAFNVMRRFSIISSQTYRKLNCQRSVFPSDTALFKALYPAAFEAAKKWTISIRNRGQVYGEMSIVYSGRLPE